MKKLTLLTSALICSASVFAGNAPRQLHAELNGNFDSSQLKHHQFKTDARYTMRAVKAADIPAPSEDIISDVPEGTVSSWSRDCSAWFTFWGYLFQEEVSGFAQQIVEAEDGSVYLDGGVAEFPLTTWVKGSKDPDGNIVIPSGQIVYEEEYDGEVYSFGLVALTYSISDEALNYEYTDQLTLTLEDGKYVLKDDVIWGLCEWTEPSEEAPDGDWYWTGYGDAGISLSPITATSAVVPASVNMEQWTAIIGENGYFCNVGIDGSDVYIGGILESAPDVVVKGTLSADGQKVVIDGGSFAGISDYHFWSYVYGGTTEEVWDDYYEEYVPTPVITGDLSFSYDSGSNILQADGVAIFTTNVSDEVNDLVISSYYEDLKIIKQVRNPEAKPADPTGVEVLDYYENYGENDLVFDIPMFDEEGTLLDSSRLYYALYVDGEPFTFYSDEYPDLEEDGVELINVNFTNYNNIWVSGITKTVYLYFQGAETIGVQSVYKEVDGNGNEVELRSNIVEVAYIDGIKNIAADAEVVSSAYFDLQGRRIANPASGLYIRRDVFSDGSVKAVKTVVK